jgi:hypothetical protein
MRICGDVLADAAPPSVLPDISPLRGEIDQRHDQRPVTDVESEAVRRSQPIAPHEGEMVGRPEGGKPRSDHTDLLTEKPDHADP